MALRATALVPLATVKSYCGIPDSSHDTTLELIIDAVSEAFNASTNRVLAKATYTNLYLDGGGEYDLLLPNYPVVSVTSLYENDVLLTEGLTYDYLLYSDEGRVHRRGGTWPKSDKIVKVTYVAGYVCIAGVGETENIPAELKLAALIQIAYEWQKQKGSSWGETARSFPDGSTTYINRKEFLPEVAQVLSRYRDMRF